MIKVPILVFEDSPLADSVELRKFLEFPRQASSGGQDYLFDWHNVYNAMGGIGYPEPLLIRSLQAYRDALNFLGDELSGEAIIFIDLELFEPLSGQRGGKAFKLSHEDVTDDLLNFAACLDDQIKVLDDRIKSKENLLEHFNPIRLGMLLALRAARNPSWGGIIAFASGRENVDIVKFQKCANTGDRILWRNLRRSLSAERGSTALDRADAIKAIINEFLDRRAGPPFWPAGTEDWFDKPPSALPHDPPLPPGSNQVVVEKVKEYLNQLLGDFTLPQSWFQSPQWETLYEVLKGLIGAHSVSAGCATPNAKNLRLPAVPLLLAAQMAWKKKSNIEWLKSFVWEPEGLVEIMAHQNRTEAQDAIRAMAVFLEHLSFGDNDSCQVIGATWGTVEDDTAKHLWIDFSIDPLNRATGRSLLQTIFGSRWGNSKGQTVSAYEEMMEHARKSGPASGPSFSLCIYPVVNDDGQNITRLDFRALEG